MQILYTPKFRKNFSKRVPEGSALEKRYKERVTLFITDRKNPILKDHKLSGKLKDFRTFSIKGDFRVVYSEYSEDTVLFFNLGTHNQVYS